MLTHTFMAMHVLGVILWMGGSIATAVAAASAGKEGNVAALAAARSAMLKVATPGLLVAWIFGLAVLVPDFGDHYAKAGWMHGKLTLALIATGLSGVLAGKLRKAVAGKKAVSPAFLRASAGVLVVLVALVVFLVFVRPGAN